jgi:hypothetical protein
VNADDKALERIAARLGTTAEWLRVHGVHRELEQHRVDVLCETYDQPPAAEVPADLAHTWDEDTQPVLTVWPGERER